MALLVGRNGWFIACTLLALLLHVMPLPSHYALLRPEFLVLLCVFWSVYSPYRFGVVYAWGLGLIYDIVVTGVWGAHAMGLAFIAYICLCAYQRLRSYQLGQQMLWVFILVGIHQVFVNWVHGLAGYHIPLEMIILPTLVTSLCWPILVVILKPSRMVWQG